MVQAVVGFGGNLEEVPATFLRALDALECKSTRVIAISALYQSVAWPYTPAFEKRPLYTNAIVLISTSLGHWSLLRQLKRIERSLGRKKTKWRNENRVLDLDLVSFGQRRMVTRKLVLPHPRAHERVFVIEPLCTVAPQTWLGCSDRLPAYVWRARNQHPQKGLVAMSLSWRDVLMQPVL